MPPTSALAPFVGGPGLFINTGNGLVCVNNSIYAVLQQRVPCAPSSTNFIYLTLSPTIAIAVNQTGFPSMNMLPIAVALASSSGILDMQDYRPDWYLTGAGGGGGGGGGTTLVATV